MNYPPDRITDNRPQFHLRWQDHLQKLASERMFDPHRHLSSLHASLSPQQAPQQAPRPHPAEDILLLGLLGLAPIVAVVLYAVLA